MECLRTADWIETHSPENKQFCNCSFWVTLFWFCKLFEWSSVSYNVIILCVVCAKCSSKVLVSYSVIHVKYFLEEEKVMFGK
jgi:hypothetical protein